MRTISEIARAEDHVAIDARDRARGRTPAEGRSSPGRRPSTNDLYETIFRDAAAVVAAELARPLTVEQVARRVTTSPRQLQRACSQIVGLSFREYVTRARMARASELLGATEAPVRQIAARVGYRAPSQFTKAFKRSYGVTPPRCGRGAVARRRRVEAGAWLLPANFSLHLPPRVEGGKPIAPSPPTCGRGRPRTISMWRGALMDRATGTSGKRPHQGTGQSAPPGRGPPRVPQTPSSRRRPRPGRSRIRLRRRPADSPLRRVGGRSSRSISAPPRREVR